MTAFDIHTEFFLSDDRKNRSYNPINKHVLTTKFERLLPPDLIHGKSILDLGSCLGAAGQWALHHGAYSYTGVEFQTDFAAKSRALLSHWNDKASIIEVDIRSYLQQCPDKSFDIVVAAGVLQVFIDPQVIIEHITRITKLVVSVEAILPPLLRTGDAPLHSKLIEICQTASNIPRGNLKMSGYGALPSKPALDFLFSQQGFCKSPWSLIPSCSEETKAFSLAKQGEVQPFRFFERYTYNHNTHQTLLESAILTGNGDIEEWGSCNFAPTDQNQLNTAKQWKFDKAVAENFSSIAHSHIPNYDAVIDLSIDVISNLNHKNPKIIDVGCATGETLSRFKKRGYTNLYGVDNSQAMLDVASINIPEATLLSSESFPTNHCDFDVVIANWTLHFIIKRIEYLRSIYQSLKPGGILILTEKTTFGDLTKSLYYDFKRKSGVTDLEIKAKETSLQGILCTATPSWYIENLQTIGFDTCDIISATCGFVTFLAQKMP